ncbi:hypothetical protein AB0L88_26025 [Saccharopolyspora shandongensis]|uniref:hypothetical protein n=1 Tax=Saccharopolyspora shandongensis TaxID=418495 RepID=UPI003413FB01
MKQSTKRRAGRGLVLVATLGAALVTATAGTAAAATPGEFTLCSKGGYDSYAAFPDSDSSTVIVPNGQCITLGISHTERYEIRIASNDETMGGGTYDPREGVTVTTVEGPGFFWS